jgi:hypothetical protein
MCDEPRSRTTMVTRLRASGLVVPLDKWKRRADIEALATARCGASSRAQVLSGAQIEP